MTVAFDFYLEFNHSEYSQGFTHRTFLASIDQYIDSLADLVQSMLRHYDYLLVPEKKLSNISENTFEYRISYRLLVPVQPPLDNLLTPGSVLHWAELLTEHFATSQNDLQTIPTEEFAISAGFRDSFLYTPVSESLIIRKSLRFTEARQNLPVLPVFRKKS